jgi:hypothetical protein
MSLLLQSSRWCCQKLRWLAAFHRSKLKEGAQPPCQSGASRRIAYRRLDPRCSSNASISWGVVAKKKPVRDGPIPRHSRRESAPWTRAAESGGSFVRSCMELQKKRPQEAWSAPERSPANLPANRASALWEALARDQNRADAFNAVPLSAVQNVAALTT